MKMISIKVFQNLHYVEKVRQVKRIRRPLNTVSKELYRKDQLFLTTLHDVLYGVAGTCVLTKENPPPKKNKETCTLFNRRDVLLPKCLNN